MTRSQPSTLHIPRSRSVVKAWASRSSPSSSCATCRGYAEPLTEQLHESGDHDSGICRVAVAHLLTVGHTHVPVDDKVAVAMVTLTSGEPTSPSKTNRRFTQRSRTGMASIPRARAISYQAMRCPLHG